MMVAGDFRETPRSLFGKKASQAGHIGHPQGMILNGNTGHQEMQQDYHQQ